MDTGMLVFEVDLDLLICPHMLVSLSGFHFS